MRIIVLGAGVIGVTTAWQLLKDGHEVSVVDREAEPASFTSFANAGLVAPGHSYAWSSPAAPRIMLRSLWRNDQAIRFRPSLDPRLWSWTLKFLRQCNTASAARNTGRKARLCLYSQQMLQQTVAETGVGYAGRQGGLLYFYRSPASFEAARTKCELLRREGVGIEVLDPDQAVRRDPGLAGAQGSIAGALLVPADESGDACMFTRALAEACRAKGAAFHLGTEVTGLRAGQGRIDAVATSAGEMTADAYVLCLGVYSPHLVKRLGIRLPIYPIKGYSVTLPVEAQHRPPALGGVDEDNLLAYCPLGDRLRLTATAEFAGYSTAHRPSDFSVMMEKARELMPEAADYARPLYWAGLRPMTPSGLPVIDRSPYDNLWLNTGHGHMGWTMSNGAARILADLVAQRQPAIARDGMTYDG